jgi:hypothetical protein
MPFTEELERHNWWKDPEGIGYGGGEILKLIYYLGPGYIPLFSF